MKKTRMLRKFTGAALTAVALAASPVAAQEAVDVEMTGSSVTLSPLQTSRDSALFKPTEMEGLADAAASFTDFNLSIGTDPANAAFTYDLVAGDFTTHTSSLLRYNADGVNIFCALSQQRCVVGVSGKDIDDDLASEEMSFSMSFDGTTFQNHGEWLENEGAYQTTYTYLQAFPTVSTVTSPATGRVWMDRNLGASRVATSFDDQEAIGDLYQWGRGNDGHEKRDSELTYTTSDTDEPGHGMFIVGSSTASYDWRSPQNDSLWQGVDGINNPCPDGFRVPTKDEFDAERLAWASLDSSGAYDSFLKLTTTGKRYVDGRGIDFSDLYSYYWTSTASGISAYFLWISANTASWYADVGRSMGVAVRCIKDE
ncbi:hypothetical protein KKHLCK_11385 [Candidatus Electrothrix laxa]